MPTFVTFLMRGKQVGNFSSFARGVWSAKHFVMAIIIVLISVWRVKISPRLIISDIHDDAHANNFICGEIT